MKKLLILSLFCTLFLSCTKEIKQVDPTKKERIAAYHELQMLLDRPDDEFRDSLLRVGHIKDTSADLHSWRLVLAFEQLAENNCFGLFKRKNDAIALACKALSQAPQSMWRKVMITLPGEGFVSPGPLMIREIQNAQLSRLRTKVIEKKLLTPHEVYTTPSTYLRFVLFLDGQVKPMYRNDSYYLLIRQMLLDSRPDQKRGSFDLLDISILNDTIVIDGEMIGTVRKLNLQNPEVEARFNSQVTKYTERKERPQKSLLKNDEQEIAPDFYAKKKSIEEESTLKEQKKDSQSGGCNNHGKRKKGLLQTVRENTFKSVQKTASPLPKHCTSITVDTKTTTKQFLTILEALSKHNLYEFSLYEESSVGVHFRTVLPLKKQYRQFTIDTIKKYPSGTILKGVSEKTRHNIIYLPSHTSVRECIEVLKIASQKRTAVIQIDTGKPIDIEGQNISIFKTFHITNKPIITRKDYEFNGTFYEVYKTPQFGETSPSIHLIGSSMRNEPQQQSAINKSNEASTNRISKKNNSGVRGNRSRANIMRTVRNNMASLKYAYNRRLRAKPGLKGKIVVKWAIDEYGHVLYCKVVSSTMKDPTFEKELVSKIKRWAFGRIPAPGDVTEVTYPFVFNN